METVSGSNNWKLVIRREDDHIVIVRAATCDSRAALPDKLFDLPVTVLGDRALAPTARAEQGEEILVTCGAVSGNEVWDNRGLEELTLPRHLERIGDYALLNCTAIHTLRFYDGIRHWSGGALLNCRALEQLHVIRVDERHGESLAYIADELSRELKVTITETDGTTTKLIFPEYVEAYEENFPAHVFDYNIYGAGYPYHHCFHQKQLSFKQYDDLWNGFRATEHESDTAIRLAWFRLRYPTDLLDWARAQYWKHLQENQEETLRWLVAEKDAAGIRFLLCGVTPDRESLAAACQQAREQEAAEVLAILLETQHRLYPVGAEKNFDL